MRRITICIRDETSDAKAVELVKNVINIGRISGEAYCYVSTWVDKYVVCSDKTRAGNDTFHVYREEGE